MKKLVLFIAIGLTVISCRKVDFDEVERTNGDADFTRYVAVGNSLTQGYQDGGVYEEGQRNSYPAIIAAQMKIVTPNMETFRQPTVNGNGSGYMHLEYINGEIEVISPGDAIGTPTEADASWNAWGPSEKTQKYNNLGVSGITLMQCVALDNNESIINNIILGGAEISIPFPPINYEIPGNPFSRFLDFGENPHFLLGSGTPIQYLDHIRNSGATFFTSWLGDNDVLGYATSGGVSTSIDGTLLGLGVVEIGVLSEPVPFRQKYDSVLTAFNSIGAKGVCATIPDVTVIPYFNTFTVQSIKDEKGYANVWIEEANGSSVIVRVATNEDLILITAKDDIEAGAGGTEANPLTNDRVLDKWEVQACRSRTIELNSAIKASAAMFNYPVVDMFAFLETLKPGITFEGIGISPKYIEGGAFSLDGVHLNPRGYAIAANQFIKTINSHYNANIPMVSVGSYRGVIFP